MIHFCKEYQLDREILFYKFIDDTLVKESLPLMHLGPKLKPRLRYLRFHCLCTIIENNFHNTITRVLPYSVLRTASINFNVSPIVR